MAIRENVGNLRPAQLSTLREAHRRIMARLDNRSYQYIAGRHGWLDEYCEHSPRIDGVGRRHHLFLPWHRAYMYHFERYLQIASGDNQLGCPYWNWRSPASEVEGIPRAYSEAMVGNQPNPLHHHRMRFAGRSRSGDVVNVDQDTQRRVGMNRSARSLREIRERATQQRVDIPQLLNEQSFGEFSEKLRVNWHNLIHLYVGGDMSNADVAAYDPIFYPHHIQIDRIWRMWQRDHGAENMPEYMKDDTLAPFRMRVRDVLLVSNLGYEYARVAGEV
jgi:tyrosinase